MDRDQVLADHHQVARLRELRQELLVRSQRLVELAPTLLHVAQVVERVLLEHRAQLLLALDLVQCGLCVLELALIDDVLGRLVLHRAGTGIRDAALGQDVVPGDRLLFLADRDHEAAVVLALDLAALALAVLEADDVLLLLRDRGRGESQGEEQGSQDAGVRPGCLDHGCFSIRVVSWRVVTGCSRFFLAGHARAGTSSRARPCASRGRS